MKKIKSVFIWKCVWGITLLLCGALMVLGYVSKNFYMIVTMGFFTLNLIGMEILNRITDKNN